MIVPTYETTAREQEIIINELRSINRTQENRISIQKEEIKRLNNIIGEATDRAIHIQKTFGYTLDDLIYLLMQGSEKE